MTAVYENGAGPEEVLRLSRGFQAASVWKFVEIEEDAVRGFLAALADNPDGYLLVTPTGMVSGLVMPLWFAPRVKLGVELFWYSELPGDGPRLRSSFESWARARGADTVQFSCMVTDREPALRRMYRRAGYEPIEIGFRKAI